MSPLARLGMAEQKIDLIQNSFPGKLFAQHVYLAVTPEYLAGKLFLQFGRSVREIGSAYALHDNLAAAVAVRAAGFESAAPAGRLAGSVHLYGKFDASVLAFIESGRHD